MKVHEIMTAHARCVGPENTLVEAAGLMRELDVGALPISENERLAGMVTDRDIVLRGTADGRDPNSTAVREVMSSGIVYVFADQPVEEAARIMKEKQIRRLPVLNRQRRLVGIVSLGDVATSSSPTFSGMALRDVSAPSHPTARQQRLAQHSRMADPMPAVPGATRRRPGAAAGRGRTMRRRVSDKAESTRNASRGGRQRKQTTSAQKSGRGAAGRRTRSRKSKPRAAR